MSSARYASLCNICLQNVFSDSLQCACSSSSRKVQLQKSEDKRTALVAVFSSGP